MVNSDNFLDIYALLVNEVAGDIWIFTIISTAIILFITLRSNMPFQVSISLSALWLMVVVAISLQWGLWAFIVFAILAFAGIIVARIYGGGK